MIDEERGSTGDGWLREASTATKRSSGISRQSVLAQTLKVSEPQSPLGD